MASWIAAGLDFGNKNIVIGVPASGGINILLNEGSERLSPSIVLYTESRRCASIFAQQNQLQHVSNTICDLKRLVCLKYNDPERETVSNIVPYQLVQLDDGFTGVKITYEDKKEKILRPEQCIAYLLKSMMALTQKNSPQITSLVIAVSPWWTEMHRRALFDACEIAKIDCVAQVNSTTAAAVTYTINHKKRLPESKESPVNVVFIDFGDSSMNVAVSKISQNSVGIKSFACDEHLGGSHFTDKLISFLVEKIQQKCQNFNPSANKRLYLRFRKATEELKKKLSINPVVQFETHSFMPENEMNFIVTREEFESQIGELISRIEAPVIQALELAHVKKEELFAIECLGGASRIPLVKSRITEIFGREPTQSLNLDECFATGSGYIAAILSPSVKIEMSVKDVAPHAVKASWADEEGQKVCEVFTQFSKVPSKCRLPVMIKKSTTIKFYSDKCDIAEATISIDPEKSVTPNNKSPNNESSNNESSTNESEKSESVKDDEDKPVKVCLRVQMTQSSTIQFIEAVYEVNGEQKQAKLTFKPLIGLSSSQIQKFRAEEAEMEAKDLIEEKIDSTRNELESFIFKAENGFIRDFPECFNPETLEDCKKTVSEIHEWFTENEFERLPLNEYQSRLDKIKTLTNPAMLRSKAFKKIFDMENTLKSRATSIVEKLQKYAELSKDDKITLIRDEFQQFMTKLDGNLEKVKNMNRFEDPVFNVDEVVGIFEGFEAKVKEMDEEAMKQSKKGRWCNIA
ncbi:dnaK protein [Tritrichomonas foetus]|uniref:DnaK protein n=1 Tax=Tritrichomonas foetus TaxID=1144522 RepID=A0A1J4JCR4_9EUKA|nr:dnaK protein [Tritrichomonas foetus]|eukprot:OHS95451.1 dnaK protein [Tritrichomonas foetus]